ncbi:MAG: ribonuclease III [Planctomycetota bacterium]
MIDDAAEILGYRFKDESLLCEALTHASSADSRLKSNERMEFLGDAILGYTVCEYLYRHYSDLLEGDLTKIKSAVVSRRVCAKISKEINLSGMLNLGKGMSGRPGLPSSVAAAVLESIIAAIYLDGGIRAAKKFILRHLKPYIEDAADSAHQQNFKSVLQQIAQKHMPGNPVYTLLDEKGPDHAKAFKVCVQIASQSFTSAWANSKKEAEQKAALNALCELGLAEACQKTERVTMVDLLEAPMIIANQLVTYGVSDEPDCNEQD